MTDKEVMQMALEALYENTQYSMQGNPMTHQDKRNDDTILVIKEALAQPATDMAYTIALQRAIEWHCEGKAVPPDVAALCPYHSEKLNKSLVQPEMRKTTRDEKISTPGVYEVPAQPEPWTPKDTAMREWQGLTDEEIIDAANMALFETMVSAKDYIYIIARAIEAKLKEKNHG